MGLPRQKEDPEGDDNWWLSADHTLIEEQQVLLEKGCRWVPLCLAHSPDFSFLFGTNEIHLSSPLVFYLSHLFAPLPIHWALFGSYVRAETLCCTLSVSLSLSLFPRSFNSLDFHSYFFLSSSTISSQHSQESGSPPKCWDSILSPSSSSSGCPPRVILPTLSLSWF